MKLEMIFYILGVIFIFASVLYFAWEFITDLPDPIKLAILIVATIIMFVVGEIMRETDL